MSFYPNGIRDERVREYLPCQRVVWQQNTTGSELLPGNQRIQAVMEDTFGEFIRFEKNGSILLDFGQELHGGIRIVNSSKIGRIRLRFGESAVEAMTDPNQDHAIHDTELLLPTMGTLEYGNTGFRFVRIDALDNEIILRNVIAVALFHDIPQRGMFRCNDALLNRIWDTAAYTLHLNMQEYLFDGIKRDRLVWCGDLYVEMAAAFAIFGKHKIMAETLDFAVHNTPDLSLLGGISSFSFWWMITLEHYVFTTGDDSLLYKERDIIEKLRAIFVEETGDDGAEKAKELRFIDWYSLSDEPSKHAGLQALLYWALCAAERCGAKLGLDTSAVTAARKRVQTHIPDCSKSPAAAALQTLSDLADRRQMLADFQLDHTDMFSSYFVLKTQPVPAMLSLLRRQWGGMLDLGATTFWEEFDLRQAANAGPIDELPVPGGKPDIHSYGGNHCYIGTRRSLCHGWGAGPAAILPERIFGLNFLEPGQRVLSVSPELGDLEYAEAIVPTMNGDIKLFVDKNNFTVDAPAGVQIIRKTR